MNGLTVFTPDVKEDGKALYGRDSIANYIYIGTTELGHEMFKVSKDGTVNTDIDRDTFKTLWDNYYIPYINGYFAADASHRTEDIKTGTVLAMTGSTSGVSYIPDTVTDADDKSHSIEVSINPSLNFADADKDVNVQQGAGYCVMKTNEAEQYAATEFLKWFTDTEQNLSFSVMSGYSPVKINANDEEKIKSEFKVDSDKSQNMLDALLVSSKVYTDGNTYTCKAFEGSKEIRDILADALEKTAAQDREKVVEAINSGKTRQEATADYMSDEYFDGWLTSVYDSLDAVLGK